MSNNAASSVAFENSSVSVDIVKLIPLSPMLIVRVSVSGNPVLPPPVARNTALSRQPPVGPPICGTCGRIGTGQEYSGMSIYQPSDSARIFCFMHESGEGSIDIDVLI